MDRELVEKVARLVISTVDAMNSNRTAPRQETVKLWPHSSPLPSPVVLAYVIEEAAESTNEMVSFSPYV